MSKPPVDPVDAAIRGYDSRFSNAPLCGMIVEYEGDRSLPHTVLALVEVLEDNNAFRIVAGSKIRIGMSVHPDDANALVADLEKGGIVPEHVQCGPGSIVNFEGCTKRGDEEVFEASRFEIVDAVPYSVIMDDNPDRQTARFAKVGEVVTDFAVWNDAREDIMAEGLYVVEDIEERPEGYGHGRNDVYPASADIVARKLREDGTYDPMGAKVKSTQKQGQPREAGRFIFVGRMPTAEDRDNAAPAPGPR